MRNNDIDNDDELNKKPLETVPIEEKEETKLRINLFSFYNIICIDFLYLILLILFSLFTVLFYPHFSTGQRKYYFQDLSDPSFYLYDFQVQPYSSYVKLYFQMGQKKKAKFQTQLRMDFDVKRKFLNNRTRIIRHQSGIIRKLKFDGESFSSSPVTIFSSHDTTNSLINLEVLASMNYTNTDGVTIYWEFGTIPQRVFFLICKVLYLFVSFIILILLIWVIYDSKNYLWVSDFTISLIFWAAFNIYLLFYSLQFSYFLYAFFIFCLRGAYHSIEKITLIALISSIRLDRLGNCFENIFVSFGIYMFTFLEFVSSFLYSYSMMHYDQINTEVYSLKIEFFINITFIFYLIVEYCKTKLLLNHSEKTHLFAFFSLSLIHFFGKLVVQYYTVIRNYYMCRQAGNTIDMTNSFLLSIFLFVLIWPIDEEEVYEYTNQDQNDIGDSLQLEYSEK